MIQSEKSKYFLLEQGDIIQVGDEYYSPLNNEWLYVNDGKPECPHCTSYDIDLAADNTADITFYHCNNCGKDCKQPNYPNAFIGYGWDADESKPVRRKNPDYIAPKFTLKIAFGEAKSKKACDNEKWFEKVKPDGGEIVIKEFDTAAELTAYTQGLEDMNGWLDVFYLIINN